MRSLSILVFFIAIRFLSLAETVVPRLSPLSSSIEKERVGLAGTWLFNTSPGERFWLRGYLPWTPHENGERNDPAGRAQFADYKTEQEESGWKAVVARLSGLMICDLNTE